MKGNSELLIITLLIIIVLILLRNFKLKKNFLSEAKEREKANEKAKKTAIELEKQKIQNLRFSLNPHSFKNTLQTIEHLSKQAYDSVHSLSDIFDYMLYDAKNQFVPLAQEISFATQYLKLYSLRLSPTVNVIKSIDQNHLEKWGDRKKIAPLVFAHFIENAFKHGDLNSSGAFVQITIDTLDDNTLIYSVRNKLSEKPSIKKGGLGNANFQDRLEILYKNNYEYDYSISENVYSANLKLTIYGS
ncbi:sensor histidine kinase [Lutibacter sp.]|uniref:sensor histidine kinase n=1 Tax=Lutibacter sp. TaxID=1925666 RepID=UPI003561A042